MFARATTGARGGLRIVLRAVIIEVDRQRGPDISRRGAGRTPAHGRDNSIRRKVTARSFDSAHRHRTDR